MPAPTTTTFFGVFIAIMHLTSFHLRRTRVCWTQFVLLGRRKIHCGCTPDAFTTAVQRGISAATKAAKSCGEPILDSKPSCFMLAIISGDCSAALIARSEERRVGKECR